MTFLTGQFTILRSIPRGIWALGFVSLLMDVSSEMIHALLPLYLVIAFGSSMETIGLIDGLAEATAGLVKLASGFISDRIGNRKNLAVIGYGLATLSKPIFALAPSIGWIVVGRVTDRIGKGIRGAPRDALVADLAPAPLRGASFGLRQSLDTVGAFLGPLIAIGLMIVSGDNFVLVFWVAVIPGVLAPLLLMRAVKEPEVRPKPPTLAGKPRFALRGIATLGPAYWRMTGIAGLYAIARFSESFLIIRTQHAGLPISLVPLILVAMNVIYAFAAYPAGVLSDRIGRRPVVMIGLACLVAADLLLAAGDTLVTAGLGILLWGAHLAFTQGTFATLVAETTPPDRRATAFGVFNMIQAFALLFASYEAGLLWDWYGPEVVFTVNGVIIALTIFCFYRFVPKTAGI